MTYPLTEDELNVWRSKQPKFWWMSKFALEWVKKYKKWWIKCIKDAKYTCEGCHTINCSGVVHHKDNSRQLWGKANNNPNNLVFLCLSCHSLIHKIMNRRKIKRV
jgi:hypothetical protein